MDIVFVCGNEWHDPEREVVFLDEKWLDDRSYIRGIAEQYGGRTAFIAAPPEYAHVREWLAHDLRCQTRIVTEARAFGDPFFSNYFKNLRLLSQSFRADALFGAFYGVPAIIVGAGASLEEVELDRSQGLILASSSALPRLRIPPHLAGAIDPTFSQIEKLAALKGVPLLYRSRLNHEALASVPSKRLYVGGGCGYPVAQWMDEQLGLTSLPVQEGFGALSFLLDLARLFGCNPIFFVGLDLSFGTRVEESEERLCVGGVQTQWKWALEAEYLSHYAAYHSEVTLINTTVGGLPVPGLKEGTLPQGAYRGLDEKIARVPQISVDIEPPLKQLSESLARCAPLIGKCDILSQVEREEEVAYQVLLRPLLERAAPPSPSDFLCAALHYFQESFL